MSQGPQAHHCSFIIVVRPSQARIQQQQQFDDAYLTQHEAAFQSPSQQQQSHPSVVASPVFEARDVHSDSDLTLQLDGLSDFGDMIDLPDLVASDSELSRHSATPVGPAVSSLRLG